MLKNVLPKVLFVAGIVGTIVLGNYFFKEAPKPTLVENTAPLEQNNE